MKITTRYVNYIYKKYRDNGEYTIGKRKHRELNSKDIETVKKIRYEYPMSGPERIRKYLKRKGIIIAKNNIYRILLSLNMVDNSNNKTKQRKYIKYERKHSNSLWHMDWTKYSDSEKLIIIEDDASRFRVGMGIYSEETIDNTIEALEIAIDLYGKPEEILTDHGTQFFSNGKNGIPGDKNKFQEYLDRNNIKHIVGRVDHPQTNGKLERLNYTIKRLRPYFSTWDEVVYYYNYKRRDMSLSIDDRPVVTPSMAYEEKGGKLNVKEQ
jgi:transposase InsO family protein